MSDEIGCFGRFFNEAQETPAYWKERYEIERGENAALQAEAQKQKDIAELRGLTIENLNLENKELRAEVEMLKRDIESQKRGDHIAIQTFRKQREEIERLTKDRDHWKANAKNQAEIRRVTLTRPDLKERSKYVQQIIAERDALRAKVGELSQWASVALGCLDEGVEIMDYVQVGRWSGISAIIQKGHQLIEQP